MELTFGPIPSRRLGRSLGINNIPPKVCSYACVYCQLGNTLKLQNHREEFYKPEDIFDAVERRVHQLKDRGEEIDYLSFVPDGEPTLDLNLGETIRLLKPLGIKIAVITNCSLIRIKEVRNDLMNADWISLKVDTVNEAAWHHIDRPYGTMDYNNILKGMEIFSKEYGGHLTVETMLVKDVNDKTDDLIKTAEFIKKLNPKITYISIPTRPPAEDWVFPPDTEKINEAYQIYSSVLDEVQLTTQYEGNQFASTGNFADDFLNIIAVHPMRVEAVEELLKKSNSDWEVVDNLIAEEKVKTTQFDGKTFYMRNLKKIFKESHQN